MGCTSSKMTVVQPVGSRGNEDTLVTPTCSRGDSAVSKHTNDSGLGLDAGEGVAVLPGQLPRKLSPLTVLSSTLGQSQESTERQTSSDILEQLLVQGIISAPPKVEGAGQAYSLMMDSTERPLRRPPARLESLKTRKEQPIISKEDIEEKMKKVEERRRVREADLRQRLRSARVRGMAKPRDGEEEECLDQEPEATPPDPQQSTDPSTMVHQHINSSGGVNEGDREGLETDSTFQNSTSGEEDPF